jgi:glutaredoxin
MNKMQYFIVLLIILYVLNRSVSKTSVTSSESKDIQMFGKDTCGYCTKMKEQLKKDGVWKRVNYLNVGTDKQAAAQFEQEDAQGVPYFKCETTGKTTTGAKPTKQLLVDLGI